MSQIHIYTGDGKGKTTAAIGLTFRAVGAGLSVAFLQFMKNMRYSEISVLEKLGVKVKQYGDGCIFDRPISSAEKALAEQGWQNAQKMISSGEYGLVVLDEFNVALDLQLLDIKKVVGDLQELKLAAEVVFTGINAPTELLENATLITEMQKKRHYYDQGVAARVGIER
ncbi:MAG: cob(I)yrinic acid a,c-diamide adenosyltransferase [Fibrobacter sp.]|nr:cob(I)yrinic acid a,c-diamide adenosyltransferase [Fibrobacter sp.]